jgi:hypothetical protein
MWKLYATIREDTLLRISGAKLETLVRPRDAISRRPPPPSAIEHICYISFFLVTFLLIPTLTTYMSPALHLGYAFSSNMPINERNVAVDQADVDALSISVNCMQAQGRLLLKLRHGHDLIVILSGLD